jgi:YD repeat-containing protein
MFFSFLYLAVRALISLLVHSGRGSGVKDVELMVLRHELERRADIVTDPLTHPTTFEPDASGLPAQVIDALNHPTTYEYLAGDLVSVTDPTRQQDLAFR